MLHVSGAWTITSSDFLAGGRIITEVVALPAHLRLHEPLIRLAGWLPSISAGIISHEPGYSRDIESNCVMGTPSNHFASR